MDRPRVLLIDDDPEAGDRLQQLCDETCEVVRSADAQDCVARLDAERWDLVLLDVNLLLLRGERLIDHLRAKAQGPLPPVLFYSAEDDAVLARLAEESGVAGYLSKGLRNAELLAAIEDRLGLHPR